MISPLVTKMSTSRSNSGAYFRLCTDALQNLQDQWQLEECIHMHAMSESLRDPELECLCRQLEGIHLLQQMSAQTR